MDANIQTFNCLGKPIEIQVRGKRSPKYRHTKNPEDKGGAYGRMTRLLRHAAIYRENPDQYAPAYGDEDQAGMCEWAFVIEQLVAEGTL